MANEIGAAIIQALPVAGAALVGGWGLNTWRTQLREGRHVKHAERALAAAAPMFAAIRLVRSRWSRLALALTATSAEQEAALKHDREERLAQAWNAWSRFQERYELAALYIPDPKRQMDVAAEVADCLSKLSQHARLMWEYQQAGERELAVKERMAFYPDLPNPLAFRPDDPIESCLKAAEEALQGELRPILLPQLRHRAGLLGGVAGGVIIWPKSRDDLTRWGLLLNGVGAMLLLISHFPLQLPSGDPPGITGDMGSTFWWWANLVGSSAGIVLTVLGIAWQLHALGYRDPP